MIEKVKDITTYPWDVIEGKITACELVKLACQRFINFLQRDDMYFDLDDVEKKIHITESLKHFKGEYAGQSFLLEPFQKFVYCAVYGMKWKKNHHRVTRTVILSMGRKGGKSSLISAMAINALLEEDCAQCIVAANSASQAGILFKMAQKYLKSIDPKGKHFRQYRDKILFDKTSSEIKVVAADASRLDGLDCSFFVQDETAAAPSSEVWDVLEQSAGSRAQPLAISCTTRGFNLSGFYKELEDSAIEVLKGVKEDDSLFTLIYTLDEGDDYEDPATWKKCQPNLGVSVFPEFVEQQITKGKNTPTQQYSIMTKVFNCWQSSSENWIQMDYIWKSMQKVDITQYQNEFCYVSFDLASVNDLTCLGWMLPYGDKFYMKFKYYLPNDSIKGNPNEERLKRWAKEGYLTITEGNVTDYDYVINDIDKIQSITPIMKISYDQWNSQSIAIELTGKGMPLEPYSQSLQSMNLPTKTLENMILSGKVIIDKNPVTAWCFENAKTKYDSLDNVRIIKNSYTQKIDGAITAIMLIGGYLHGQHFDCNIIGTTY
jgi:Phage terminase-like protein, large subunit